MDTVLVIQAFQQRADYLQSGIDSIQALIENTQQVVDSQNEDVTEGWIAGEVAKLVRLYSEKAMTDAVAELWVNKRL